MTASLADRTWAWVQPPLARLAESYTTEPDTPWDDRIRAFLDDLGLGQAADHPVTAALLDHLDALDEAQREAFLTGEAESFVYQTALRQPEPVEQHAEASEQHGAQPDEQAVRELTDQAYRWVVEQLTAEDPDFPAQLANDPELAQAIYDEAVRRLGTAAN